MKAQQQSPQTRVIPRNPQQPLGGALIDADGREIPITEQMIQQACRELERAWQAPRRAS
ncbi:PA1571 family protein [Pseudomonas sp. CAU 1711]|uniref:PA1571 family protein n=1 Tax=Pseudomonas sp. CAU 1711 TaxID=3140356 RepID=UPI0032618AAB